MVDVQRLRDYFDTGATRSIDWREAQLDAVLTLLAEAGPDIVGAIAQDLGRHPTETLTQELGVVMLDAQHARENVRDWAADRAVEVADMWQPAEAFIRPEPKGVVLVLGAWNFPVQLVIEPLVAAIASGNVAVVKPSEVAPATAAVLARELRARLDPQAFEIVEGGPEVAEALLRERYDHIFFTGSSRIGRLVAQAAAQHLTPCTLELGGKNPTYVHQSADIAAAAERLVWTKLLNVGQTCVAPDYVLVDEAVRDDLVQQIATTVERFYGADVAASSDYGRVVNTAHAQRLLALRDGEGSGTIAFGGGADVEARFVEPTVLIDPTPESAIMQDEVFGPLLPVITVDGLDAAVAWTRRLPKPLAGYVFSGDTAVADEWMSRVPAGGSSVNVAVMHSVPLGLPFGGVGESGYGTYHGKAGFDELSHLRSVVVKPAADDLSALMPPYADMGA